MKRVWMTLVIAVLGLLPMQAMAASHGKIYVALSERVGVEIPEIVHGQKPIFDAHRTKPIRVLND